MLVRQSCLLYTSIANLVSATTFCSIFVFRPFGALFFGYIGDTIGRKATVIITTLMMACCCVFMAILPTYAQIGITAAWLLTICRIMQLSLIHISIPLPQPYFS